MSAKLEKLEKNMGKFTIEVPVEEVEKAIEKAFQKNKSKFNVPGFRKGKVPRQMVEKMYGVEVFFEDAANMMIQDAYEKTYDETEEEIVSSPEIDVVQLEKGKEFIFTATVALKPEVTLGKYKGVSVEKIDVSVSDEEVAQSLEKEREKNARTVNIEDRAVLDGDMTVIDFEGFVDGVAFEGGKGENYPLTIGSNSFIPGFEEQLIGAKIGDDVDVNVTFPEEYHSEELKGKPALFKCKVHEIKVKELPELDDEFASEVSEFDTLDEYKEQIKKNLVEFNEKEAKSKKEEAVISAIIEDATMDIPEAMIKTQQRQMLDEYAQRIQMQGLSIEQYFQYTGTTPEMLQEQMKPQAEKRIQSRLVLEAVAEAEGFVASDEEYEAEIAKLAESYQMEVDKIKEIFGDSQKKDMMKDIVITKAVEFVVDNAKEAKAKKTTKKDS